MNLQRTDCRSPRSRAVRHQCLAAPADTSKWKCELCPAEETGVSGRSTSASATRPAKTANSVTTTAWPASLPAVGGRWPPVPWRCRRSGGSLERRDPDVRRPRAAGRSGPARPVSARLGYSEITRHQPGRRRYAVRMLWARPPRCRPVSRPAPDHGRCRWARRWSRWTTKQAQAAGRGLAWTFSPGAFSARVSARHDVRDGTQRTAGRSSRPRPSCWHRSTRPSIRSEATADFRSRTVPGIGRLLGRFRNNASSLTGQPFAVGGRRSAASALAPDNEFKPAVSRGCLRRGAAGCASRATWPGP